MKSFNIGDLKISVPIIQGGMGIGISLAGLASAVSNMGGIGTISSVGIGLVDKNNKFKEKLAPVVMPDLIRHPETENSVYHVPMWVGPR